LNRSKEKNKAVKRILVLRFSSIGDIVLTTPVLRCLKRKYPDAAIHYFTKKNFASLLLPNPYIAEVHTLSEDLSADIAALKAINFDMVVDLHHNLRTLRVKQALGVKQTYRFPKLNIQKWLYVNLKWNILPPKSIVERYFEPLKNIGVINDGQGLDFFIPEGKDTSKDDIPMGHWMGYVACVIGGSFATKQLPEAKWVALINKCPYPVILLGGPEDKDLGARIAAADPVKVYNACGKFNLLESADLVRKARVVVSNDTGLMHIATAFQKPLVSLWGNTTPWLGMFPYYGANNLSDVVSPKFTIEEVQGLKCRPCSKIGYNKCPKGHFKCMLDIDIDKAVEHILALWQQNEDKNITK
jgi:ADP-heptose:LPS heptosyltransferase